MPGYGLWDRVTMGQQADSAPSGIGGELRVEGRREQDARFDGDNHFVSSLQMGQGQAQFIRI